ncbi:MAG: RnfABCDGE type electron transport complex subunit G [Dehalococcoidia bacterium]|nr:MAG: RnfABCDGE type electron transport complex subunit G [Dehalococcoidia bacterium]
MLDKNALKKAFPVILLTIVVAISVNLLSFADRLTRPQIEAQQQLKIQNLLTGMFPDMSRYDFKNDIYTIYSDGAKIGYAFIAVGKGYGGDIDILVGLEDDTTIKGISIVSHSETPGLGSRITESFFTNQFAGLSIDEVALKRDGGEVDAITGSTISSRAVINAVRETAMEKVKQLDGSE